MRKNEKKPEKPEEKPLNLPEDKTRVLEQTVQKDRKPKAIYVARLWSYIFSSVRVMSAVYLGVFVSLSLLQPVLAFIWGSYISSAENAAETFVPSLALITAYFLINYLTGLMNRYVGLNGGEDIEQLSYVQANRQQEFLQSKIFSKISSVSAEYLEIAKINDNISQVFNFSGERWGGASRDVMLQSYAVIAKIVSIISIALSLYIFNPWLCVIAVAAPLPSIYSMTLGQKLKFRFVKDNTKLQRRINYFQSLMLSPAGKELKTFGLHDYFYKRWKDLADEYTLKEKKLIRAQTLLNMVNTLLSSSANIAGSVFAIVLMTAGRITLGALGAVMSLTGTLIADTSALLSSFSTLVTKKNEAAQFFDLMELPEQKADGAECGGIDVIEAKNLKYRYPLTEKYVLDGVSIKIRKGEKVAFVGENGAGKTTLVKLITGTLFPSAGELLVNGVQVESMDPISKFGAISAVVQDPSHYETFTVGDNVFLGDVGKARDESGIDEAIGFSDFDGAEKDMLLGKDIGGAELSGGQWQKLAIARAAYRSRDFIILDEPTSNLDPFAEADIFKKYIALSKDKTVIFVTHRVSAASLADRIVVFDGGKIVQDGPHGELLKEGRYARLYQEQAKWYDH